MFMRPLRAAWRKLLRGSAGCALVFATAATTATTLAAAAPEPAPVAVPDQREMWVPAKKLKEILTRYPKAVVLSREQYQRLVTDATVEKKSKVVAPRRAVLTEARYQAQVDKKVVQVTGELTVQLLGDEWSEVVLDFGSAFIGTVKVDGEAALIPEATSVSARSSKTAANAPRSLLLRGRGERKITVEFAKPITMEAGLSSLRVELPSAATGNFVLNLPPNQRVTSQQAFSLQKTAEATIVKAVLPPVSSGLEMNWRGAGDAAQTLEPLVLVNGIYFLDAEKVRAEFGFAVETQLGNLPLVYHLPLPPKVKVLQVTGNELAKWEVANDRLTITLQGGERAVAKFWLALEAPALGAAPRATVDLPMPRVEGLARMQGVFSVVGEAGVTIEQVATDETVSPTERACDPQPYFVGSYKFLSVPNPARVTVERVQPRFTADLDTLVEFSPEAIFIERTLTVHPEKGQIFSTALTLPAGEEVLSVHRADDTEPDWRTEGGKLRLRWSDLEEKAGGGSADRVFKVRTRIEPEKWTQLGTEGTTFTLGDAKIEGAEKVTGYIALRPDAAFRLEAEASETLERRDGRATPVKGDYAWFRRAEFGLTVKVVKRPGEILSALVGYALPLEGVLDLHAQMNYEFLYSGARSVKIRVPKDIAANFNFDGPQIAERNLVEDVWTIVFQKELTGEYALRITAQVPVAASKDAAEARFKVAVPLIVPLDVVRTSGVWVVEANTETEITFDAKGMNELDSLLAPALPDYQPRHRVIGVFAWLGGDYALSLSGVRHAPAAMLTTVVDQLLLDTVISTSGTERSQAVLRMRTAGAQYLDVQLPEKSRLLSLLVNGALAKPVGDRADQVRVQLPARRNANEALTVSLLYETPRGEWGNSGGYATRAPQLAKHIPVLRSSWRLYLPDGFEYLGMESNLRVPRDAGDRTLVTGAMAASRKWLAQGLMGKRTSQALMQVEHEMVAEPASPPGEEDEQQRFQRGLIMKKLERTIIPRLEFREATVREALDYLRRKSVELDSDNREGVNMILRLETTGVPGVVVPPPVVPNIPGLDALPALPPSDEARITVSLSNIPLSEALKYVTNLANLKFKVEPQGIVIVPASVNTDVLVTREWKIRPDLIASLPSEVTSDREAAKAWLISNGVQFNGQATAIYVPANQRLIVRNTEDQLDLIDTMLSSASAAGTGLNLGGLAAPPAFGDFAPQRVTGLLPMKIELPLSGRMVVLDGLSAAEHVEFHYEDWWNRAQRLWLWFVAGGLVCLFTAREKPWWRTCWAILWLTFFPLVVFPGTMAICNALLAGWLISLVLQRMAVWLVFARRKKEVLA